LIWASTRRESSIGTISNEVFARLDHAADRADLDLLDGTARTGERTSVAAYLVLVRLELLANAGLFETLFC